MQHRELAIPAGTWVFALRTFQVPTERLGRRFTVRAGMVGKVSNRMPPGEDEVEVDFEGNDNAFIKVRCLAVLPPTVGSIHPVRFVSSCGAICQGQEGVAVRIGIFSKVFVAGVPDAIYPLRGQIVLV